MIDSISKTNCLQHQPLNKNVKSQWVGENEIAFETNIWLICRFLIHSNWKHLKISYNWWAIRCWFSIVKKWSRSSKLSKKQQYRSKCCCTKIIVLMRNFSSHSQIKWIGIYAVIFLEHILYQEEARFRWISSISLLN